MRKAFISIWLTILGLALLMAACAPALAPGSEPEAEPVSSFVISSEPVPAESTPSIAMVPSAPQPPPEEDLSEEERAVLGAVNDVLANYHAGVYPEPIIWESESPRSDHVPEGITLPEAATYADLEVIRGEEMAAWTATLPLDNDFALLVYLSDAYYPIGVDFADELPARTGAYGIFSDIRTDRLNTSASFEGLVCDGAATLNGWLTWQHNNHRLWLNLDDGTMAYSLSFTDSDDATSFTLDFPPFDSLPGYFRTPEQVEIIVAAAVAQQLAEAVAAL